MGADDYIQHVPTIQAWIRTQSHLPQNIDPVLLHRFIHSVYGNLEKTKKLIDLSYSMRNQYSHIFLKRDPHSIESKNIYEVADMMPLPYATKENYKVMLYRMADLDADKFNFTEAVKMFFMVADVRFVSTAANESNSGWNGEVPIFDMAGFTLRHLTCVVLSVLRIYMKYTQEAHPVRLRHIHVINCTTFVDRVMALVRPFLRKEVSKLLHFHKPNSDTLYKFVPKDLLPTEYGGKVGEIQTIKNAFSKVIDQYRDYLMDETRWKLNNPSNRGSCGKSNVDQEISGNFRTLCID